MVCTLLPLLKATMVRLVLDLGPRMKYSRISFLVTPARLDSSHILLICCMVDHNYNTFFPACLSNLCMHTHTHTRTHSRTHGCTHTHILIHSQMQRARIHSGGGSMPSLQAIDSTQPPSIDMQVKEREIEGERDRRREREEGGTKGIPLSHILCGRKLTLHCCLSHPHVNIWSTISAKLVVRAEIQAVQLHQHCMCYTVCCAIAGSGSHLYCASNTDMWRENAVCKTSLLLHQLSTHDSNVFLLHSCLKTVCCCNTA